jgi:hypothetical protein
MRNRACKYIFSTLEQLEVIVKVVFVAEVPVYDAILEVIQNVQTCLRVGDLACRSIVKGEGNGVVCVGW